MKLRPLTQTAFRAISIFSGVKMLSIVCSLVRNKLIAVLLGPAGMGLISLYNSAIEMLSSVARLSIDQSAIRDISADTRPEHAAAISKIVRTWSLWLGFCGALLMCAISPLLSNWMFGTYEHWLTFCALSLVPLSTTIAVGRTSLLTGLNMLGRLAKASVWTAIIAVVVSVALLLLFGEKAIVPMIIANGVVTLLVALAYSPRLAKVKIPLREIFRRGAGFIRLGALMTIASFVSYLFSYLFVIYLNRTASTADVGLYQTGYTLVNTYVGVVLAGVWVEYYPRLSRAIHSARATAAIVSHEIVLTLCVLLPVVTTFIAADSLVVRLLYDKSFIAALPFISIAVVGVMLRTYSWCVAFVVMARGDGMMYVVVESIDAMLGLALNIAGWKLGGMAGLGIAYILWYAIYSVMVTLIYRKRYGLRMPAATIGMALLMTAIAASALVAKIYLGWWAALIITLASLPLPLRVLRRKK